MTTVAGANGDRMGPARQACTLRADRSAQVEQLDNSLDAMKRLQFTDAELTEIDRYAQDGAIDIWEGAREGAA